MIPLEELIIIPQDGQAIEALERMAINKMGKVFICNEDGKLAGIVSKTDIINAAKESQERKETFRSSITKMMV